MIYALPAMTPPVAVKQAQVKVVNTNQSQNTQSKQLSLKNIPLSTHKAYNLSFRGANLMMGQNNLNVDLSGLNAYGVKKGINWDQEFAKNQSKVQSAMDGLFARKNQDGQWLKWIDLPTVQRQTKVKAINDYVNTKVRNKFDDVVILGIGGSSLGAKAVIGALADSQWNLMTKEQRGGLPRIHFIENIDPDQMEETLGKLNLSNTLINVISKSGTTPETSATFLNIKERMEEAVGKENANKHILAITDKDSTKSVLKSVATQEKYDTFEVPDDVGGRYSVFSDVGLVPAAMAGIDIDQLLKGAEDMSKFCENTKDIKKNPAANQALAHTVLYEKGVDLSKLWVYSSKASLISNWYVQLWAESLGKEKTADGKVVNLSHTPIGAVGAIDQHSSLQLDREGADDKVHTIISIDQFKHNVQIAKNPNNIPDSLKYMRHNSINTLMNEEVKATTKVLSEVDKHPVMNIKLPKLDAYNVGQLLQMFMLQTAAVGELQGLGINTFLQPAVEEGKIIAKKEMTTHSEANAPK